MESFCITTGSVSYNGMQVECLQTGAGPLVLFLHGFPDHPGSWRDMMLRFANAGFQAVAPYMRGYSPASRAPDGAYRDWATGGDALSLIAALGHDRAVIVGHDWGAAAAYAAAQLDPSKVDCIVTLAVPFGPALREAIVYDGDQQRRSWYWYYFQLPFAREAVAHNNFAFLDRIWSEWSPGYRLPREEAALLRAMFVQDSVLDEVLKYYHQLFRPPPVEPPFSVLEKLKQRISVPTLYLHGQQDGCIGVEVGADVTRYYSGPYERVVVEDAGHFLHLEQPETTFSLAIAFLERHGLLP